jgi:hypothetical protein
MEVNMHRRQWLAAALWIAGTTGCASERVEPTAPAAGEKMALAPTAAPEQISVERLAKELAGALRTPAVRARIHNAIRQSRFRESKLSFQALLREKNGELRQDIAAANGVAGSDIDADVATAGPLELYLPVPEHREHWSGTDDYLVATSFKDGDNPVAFDRKGNRLVLDPATPPAAPVLALVRAETDFSRDPGPSAAKCTTCSGGGGGSPPPPTGIYLTQTAIYDLHEDWIRGSPEIEAMLMGPTTDTTKMVLLSCSNESAVPPRYYDQDNTFWYGNVLIADSAQLNRIRTAYPPGTPWSLVRFTVAFWEDDTGRCQIAGDSDTWTNKLKAAGMAVLGGMVVLTTDWSQPIDVEAWPFIAQLPLGLLGLGQTIGGTDDFIGITVNRTVWNPVHPNDQVVSTQVLLDGGTRTGTATLVWR